MCQLCTVEVSNVVLHNVEDLVDDGMKDTVPDTIIYGSSSLA